MKPPPEVGDHEVSRSKLVERTPVYYGWIILLAGTFGLFMTTPGQTVGVSVFLDSIIGDLGLSRSTVSLLYTFATLTGSLALPFVGRFVDTKGPRRAVIFIAALFALACLWMGFIKGMVGLFIGFLLIRSLGQGSLSLVSLHVINLWFIQRRGLAVGLSGMGFALSFALFPPFIDLLIGTFGWRNAYPILGGLIAITVLPVGALFFRGHPESYGLTPDGRGSSWEGTSEQNFTPAEARRTLSFWLYTAATFCFAMLGTALLFHNYDILGTGGISRSAATGAFGALGFVAAGANLGTGVLLDRLAPRYLLSVTLSLLCLSLYLATAISTLQGVLLYGSVLGLMQGMNGAISASVFAHYFGRRHLGAIKGTVQTVGVVGSAIGPFLFAFGQDLMGSYRPVLLLSALLPLGLALIAPFIRPPHKRDGKNGDG
jgi:sugar phosphate permease